MITVSGLSTPSIVTGRPLGSTLSVARAASPRSQTSGAEGLKPEAVLPASNLAEFCPSLQLTSLERLTCDAETASSSDIFRLPINVTL